MAIYKELFFLVFKIIFIIFHFYLAYFVSLLFSVQFCGQTLPTLNFIGYWETCSQDL